jgi:hypothetical protein
MSVQVLGILAFTLALFIVWDFSQRVVTTLRLAQSEQELDQRVAQAQATRTALIEQKKRVQTNAFAEDYVRRNWHWARDGETVVIPQVTPATPKSATSTTPPPQTTWWQDLLEFLFGR